MHLPEPIDDVVDDRELIGRERFRRGGAQGERPVQTGAVGREREAAGLDAMVFVPPEGQGERQYKTFATRVMEKM